MAQIKIFPNADVAGEVNQFLSTTPPFTHYEHVYEDPPDDNATYCSANDVKLRDLYASFDTKTAYPKIANIKTINWIEFHLRCKNTGSSTTGTVWTELKPLGAVAPTEGAATTLPTGGAWANYTLERYTTNPVTHLAWTVTDLQNLQAGDSLQSGDSKQSACCTQLYLLVDCTIINYKDIPTRFKLTVRSYKDTPTRFILIVQGYRDTATRFLLYAVGHRDINTRFILVGQGYRDTATRFYLITAAPWHEWMVEADNFILQGRPQSAHFRL